MHLSTRRSRLTGSLVSLRQAVVRATGAQPLRIFGSFPAGNVGTPYSSTPLVTGGSPPINFALSGVLLPGLDFNASTGAITGLPTDEGTISGLKITASDAKGSAVLGPFTLTVNAAPRPILQREDGAPILREDGSEIIRE